MAESNADDLFDEFSHAHIELIRNDRFIDWEYWIGRMPLLNTQEATLLMAALDPFLYEDLDSEPTNNDVSDAKHLVRRMRLLAERQSVAPMPASAWQEWALQNGHQPSKPFCAALVRHAPKAVLRPHGSDEPARQGPLPIPTSVLANCFAGIGGWTTPEQWKKPLGDVPKWLERCQVAKGQRGKSEATWDPVLVGAQLVRRKLAKPNSVRSKFKLKDDLKPWLDAWLSYEADYLDDA